MKKYRAPPPLLARLACDMCVSISICAGMFVFLYFCLFLSFSNPLCVCHWMYEQWDHYCVWGSDYIPDFLNLQPILRCPNDIFLIHFLCSTVFFFLDPSFWIHSSSNVWILKDWLLWFSAVCFVLVHWFVVVSWSFSGFCF